MPHGRLDRVGPASGNGSPKPLPHRVPRGDRHQSRGSMGQDPGLLPGGRIPRLHTMASTLSSPRPMKSDRMGRYKTYLAGIAIACLVALALPSSGAVSGADAGQPANSNLAQQLAVPAYIDPTANPGAWAQLDGSQPGTVGIVVANVDSGPDSPPVPAGAGVGLGDSPGARRRQQGARVCGHRLPGEPDNRTAQRAPDPIGSDRPWGLAPAGRGRHQRVVPVLRIRPRR